MHKKVKVLFVCLGNICRSPMAEAIFNEKIKKKKLDALSNSVGTAAYHVGEEPDHRTRKVLENNGIITQHRAQHLKSEDALGYDIFIGMDYKNVTHMHEMLDVPPNKIVLMRDFDKTNPGADVPDPYYGNMKSFEEVYDILVKSIDGLIEHIIAQAKK